MTDQLTAASVAAIPAAPASANRSRARTRPAAHLHVRDVVKAVALEHGACIRPVQLRKINMDTGEVEQVMIPCGTTLTSICAPCAERAKVLRAAQCWEGWHLEDEPAAEPCAPDSYQRWLIETCADLQAQRELAELSSEATCQLDDLIEAVRQELATTGVRGRVDLSTQSDRERCAADRCPRVRRHRSTRRRQDAPDLPKRKISRSTVGRVYCGPNGSVPAVDVHYADVPELWPRRG